MAPADQPRADARRNRAKVIAAAEKAFAAEGLAVPLDEIARRAEVGPGTVYRHFPTKDALFEAVVADQFERLATEARAAAKADDPTEAFFRFARHTIAKGLLNKAICEVLDASALARIRSNTRPLDAFRRTLREFVTRAQRAGGVRPDLSPADAKAVMVAALGVARQARSRKDRERLVEIVLDGLRPRP